MALGEEGTGGWRTSGEFSDDSSADLSPRAPWRSAWETGPVERRSLRMRRRAREGPTEGVEPGGTGASNASVDVGERGGGGVVGVWGSGLGVLRPRVARFVIPAMEVAKEGGAGVPVPFAFAVLRFGLGSSGLATGVADSRACERHFGTGERGPGEAFVVVAVVVLVAALVVGLACGCGGGGCFGG